MARCRLYETFLLVVALAAGGCASGSTASPVVSASPVVRPLASTYNPSPPVALSCNDALLEGTLEADSTDAWGAWLKRGGVRVNVQWPPGFAIAFASPRPQLLAPDGNVVAATGDQVSLGGGFGPGSEVFGACRVNGILYNHP
jgi:hypothetical protein